jgi:uncharacterized protein YyaL (SSP411 family)
MLSKAMQKYPKHTNSLIHESSPYLLQHAHNPVDWLPWGNEARSRASKENKLILVSIGYAACHWCHVMERECFEDQEVAALMNKYFVCIKVDREERPDVDQVHMEAVQMMTRQGGWPLNCFTTPDGKPIYGGTYFPKPKWISILRQLNKVWNADPEQVNAYGDKLLAGMEVSGVIEPDVDGLTFDIEILEDSIAKWKQQFDPEWGGPNKAPKFPLPTNYTFLMHYGKWNKDVEVLRHVTRTLDKMAQGGIYDQVGGGFARYSTDVEWKVPHFEKMLYDNAQLLGLYAEAYQAFANDEYLEICKGIKSWLYREMRHPSGGYYSALDADSEGVEGLFYTFNQDFPKEDEAIGQAFARFYHTGINALWEGRIIPVRKTSFEKQAEIEDVPESELVKDWNALNKELLQLRSAKVRPALDDKCLCSWNAMLASAFAKSYIYTGDVRDLDEARNIMRFVERNMTNHDTGGLFHTWKNNVAKVDGFLEDYAFAIEAYILLYQADFDFKWLKKAKSMAFLTLDRFYDDTKGIFFFTPIEQTDLISRPVELSDNVIPSSNAVMAQNLDTLAAYFDLGHFREKAERLLGAMPQSIIQYGAGYSHWADLHLRKAMGSPEIVVTGDQSNDVINALRETYMPLAISAAGNGQYTEGIFTGRIQNNKTAIYICRHATCQQPLFDVQEAREMLLKIYSPD